MKMKGTAIEDASAPLGPAKRHAGHSPRNISARAGAKKAWRNDAEHPLSLAYAKGQLIRGNENHTSQQRFEAGDEYRLLFETMHRSGRDSTDINLVSGGAGFSLTQAMADATKRIIAIDSHLKNRIAPSYAASAAKAGGPRRPCARPAASITTAGGFRRCRPDRWNLKGQLFDSVSTNFETAYRCTVCGAVYSFHDGFSTFLGYAPKQP
jgi:hypothetical protein